MEAILIINQWESLCGRCGQPCDPDEKSHVSRLGFDALERAKKEGLEYPLQGCGAVYTAVSSDYIAFPDLVKSIKEMRPDLPYVEGFLIERG